MHKKHAPSRSRTATQGRPCGLFTMSAFDCLVTISAKTGTQRCQVAAWLYMPLAACSVPFSAKMRMLIAIAIVPRHSKARTMSTRRSFRCWKSGLAVFFLATGTTTILRAAGFGATLGPDGGYSVVFQALFLYFLERLCLDLRGKDFTFVIPTTGPPRNWRWTWSISEVLASFRVRQ